MLDHLLIRVRDREISKEQLGLLALWLKTDPEVPSGPWFKRFPGMIACGEGSLSRSSRASVRHPWAKRSRSETIPPTQPASLE